MIKIDEQSGIDLEQVMNVAKMLGTLMPPENKEEQKEIVVQYEPITFDEELQTQEMKMIKSVLPYMGISQQKIIGVLIKFMEIKNLIEKDEKDMVFIQSKDDEELSKDILKAVQPYCPEEKKDILNILLRMMDLKKILIQVEGLKEVL